MGLRLFLLLFSLFRRPFGQLRNKVLSNFVRNNAANKLFYRSKPSCNRKSVDRCSIARATGWCINQISSMNYLMSSAH